MCSLAHYSILYYLYIRFHDISLKWIVTSELEKRCCKSHFTDNCINSYHQSSIQAHINLMHCQAKNPWWRDVYGGCDVQCSPRYLFSDKIQEKYIDFQHSSRAILYKCIKWKERNWMMTLNLLLNWHNGTTLTLSYHMI